VNDAIAPLRQPRYRALWIAGIFSNLGSFFQTVAASWLMKELTDASATWVGLMVASNLLPLLFLALIAGVVADMFDRARVMLVSQVAMGAAAAAMAVLTALDLITPGLLLGLGLVLGTALAFNLPAAQALVPDLVPRGMVASAVALNSAAFNVARAVGPAAAGVVIATSGPELGFTINAVSFVGVIAVVAGLVRSGSRPSRSASTLSIAGSIGMSIRYARFTPVFRRLLGLVALFAVTSAVVQAVLPNRTGELGGGETTYGLLLGAMGAGALVAALGRARFTARAGTRGLPITIGGFGLAGVVVGAAPSTSIALVGMFVSGVCWVWTLTTLNSSTQLMSPEWIRGRAMSLYLLAFSGVFPIGAILAGLLADRIGAGAAMVAVSGATILLGVASPRFRVPPLDRIVPPEYSDDVAQPAHVVAEGGPVMVVNTWEIERGDLEAFLGIMQEVRLVRLRTGAYDWTLYRNTADPHRLTEVFLCVSWEEHLEQHRRIDDVSMEVLVRARRFDRGAGPRTRHLIAVDPNEPSEWEQLIDAHDLYHRTDGSIPLTEVPRAATRRRLPDGR
jgi:MFS family permease